MSSTHPTRPTTKLRSVNLLLAGIVLALICAATLQQAVTTQNGSNAFIFSVLAAASGTMFFGWLILAVLITYNRLKDRTTKK